MPALHTHTPATEMWVSHHLLSVQYQMTQLTVSLVGQDSGLFFKISSFPSPTAHVHTRGSISKYYQELIFVPPCLMCCAWSSAGRRQA